MNDVLADLRAERRAVEPSPEAVAAVAEAVRFVEDAIDATSDYRGGGYYACGCRTTSPDTGPAIVRAFVEHGWSPPAPTP